MINLDVKGATRLTNPQKNALWRRRRGLLVAAHLAGLLPLGALKEILESGRWVENPWVDGDIVRVHAPLSEHFKAFETKSPHLFQRFYLLPSWAHIEWLASTLRLPEIVIGAFCLPFRAACPAEHPGLLPR